MEEDHGKEGEEEGVAGHDEGETDYCAKTVRMGAPRRQSRMERDTTYAESGR